MEKIRILIAGYGNVGRGVVAALKRNPDMELAGIISRSPDRVRKEVTDVPVLAFDDVAGFLSLKADVAILCGGSKNDLPQQGPRMAQYMNTVDSFDNHSRVPEYFHTMDEAAKKLLTKIEADLSETELASIEERKTQLESSLSTYKQQLENAITKAENDAKARLEQLKADRINAN